MNYKRIYDSLISRIGRDLGIKRSEQTKLKMSIAQKKANKHRDQSFKQTEEYKSSQSLKQKEVWAKRKAGILPYPKNNKREELNNGLV